MTYRKPEINALGDAARVIQSIQRKISGVDQDPMTGDLDFNPAYDLDE